MHFGEIGKLKVRKVERFDRELTLWISGSDCDFESWNSSVMSFRTCMQNLRLF